MGSHLNREGKRKRKEKKRGERERAESQRSGKKGLEAVTRLGGILITRPRVKEREGENGENRAALARARACRRVATRSADLKIVPGLGLIFSAVGEGVGVREGCV